MIPKLSATFALPLGALVNASTNTPAPDKHSLSTLFLMKLVQTFARQAVLQIDAKRASTKGYLICVTFIGHGKEEIEALYVPFEDF